MAVNLSPIGGVAAQFFDNSGNPLTGGKIYTYAAGTTTPQATYTSSGGTTAHSNPIILDAAGRVPSGEIWLLDGIQYKFLIKTSADVQIGSYDNIIGINSNFVNYTNSQEIQTATAGQTVFTLTTMAYQPGTNSLSVFVDGVNQYGPGASYAYQETNSATVTFTSGLHVGAQVKFTTSAINASSYGDASQVAFVGFKNQVGNVQDLADADGSNWIGFEPAGTSAVARSAQDKLRETVSVKDFGATGNGTTNDTPYIQAAVDAVSASGGGTVFFPEGTYACANIIPKNNVALVGEIQATTILLNNSAVYSMISTWTLAPGSSPAAITAYVAAAPRTSNFSVSNLTINNQYDIHPDNGDDNHQHGVYLFKTTNCAVYNCYITKVWYVGVESYFDCFDNSIHNNTFYLVGDKPTIVAPTGFYYGVGLDNGATRCTAKWNYFDQCGHAINKIVDFFHSEDCVIEGNTFGTLEGLFLTHRNGGKRLIVRNNTGGTCGSSFISISADAGNQLGGGYCENPTITGNACNDFNTLNGASVAGIVVTANGHKIVANNRVRHIVTGASRGCIGINMNGPAPSGSCTSQVQNNYLQGNFPNYQAIRFNQEPNFVEASNVIDGATEGVFVDASATNGSICLGTKFINVTTNVSNASSTTRNFGFRQTYTPVITAASGGFSLGNGSVSGDYQVLSNNTVQVSVTFNAGSTTNFGVGVLLCTLPIASDLSERIGSFFLADGASSVSGISRSRGDGTVDFFAPTGVSGTSPVAISATANLKFSLIYKI